MAAVKFYFRCLVIVLFILCVNARSYNHTNSQLKPSSHKLSGQASKNPYSTSSGLSGDKKSHQLYPDSGGLSGSGRPSSSFPRPSGLSGTGSGTRKPERSVPYSNGLSRNSSSSSHELSVQASKNPYSTSSGLSGDKPSHQLYPDSSGLSGSGLSGTGNGTRKPEPSFLYSNSLSRNSSSSSHELSGQASKNPYSTSSGLSGDKSSHQLYPDSGGLSGSGRPSSRFELSGQASKNPYSNSSRVSGNQTSHQLYPDSGGLSGSGLSGTGSGTRKPEPSYPYSNGLSGDSPSTYSGYIKNYYKNTNTHTHTHKYVYKPPSVIHYTPDHRKSAVRYPVYTGHHVPLHVYKYRSSKNKYRMLLAGLALYNLGMISTNPSIYDDHKHYAVRPDEVCKFGVRYKYGSYEEMDIDCKAITYFILEEEWKLRATQQVVNQTIVKINVQTQSLLPNGTLSYPGVGANTSLLPNGTLLNTTNTIFTTNTTISDSKYDGSKVAVSSSMECYILRYTSYSSMRKTIPCKLLYTYAVKSLRNYGVTIKSPAPWLLIILTVALKNTF